VDLSVLIPARNERWLPNTVEDVLAHSSETTEVIIVLDGAWPETPLPQDKRVEVLFRPESIGQRAAVNMAARISRAKYIMKLDAHCSVAPGFDEELIRAAQELEPDVTQVPAQFNLHVFQWICNACGHEEYQGPTKPCPKCGGERSRKLIWKRRESRLTTAWVFDEELHFQYSGELKKRQRGELPETMSMLGACWFLSRERYWQIDGMDEAHGSWGNMGTELACKSWLSGGRVVTNKRTSFAHLFRTQGSDFGFPYPISGKQVSHARKYSRDMWVKNAWSKQVRSLSWLVDRFWPVKGWSNDSRATAAAEGVAFARVRKEPGPTKGIVWYSDARLDPAIASACRRWLAAAANGHQIVTVSLAPVDFGDARIVMDAQRGVLTLFRQILAGLEACETDVVFLAEHDVGYHPSHFEFIPPRSDVVFYNENVWKVDVKTGRALHYLCRQTSGLCAYRQLLLEHYRKRVALVEEHGFSRKMGFEPGTHGRDQRVDDLKSEGWWSEHPNIDIRHEHNLTPSRWRQDQFRNQRSCRGWTEADEVPGWGKTKGRTFIEWREDR